MRGSIFILFILLFISCGKDHADEPTQPTPQDTLSSGWTKVVIPDSAFLNDIFFINNNLGYTIEEKKVWKSTNGGLNWTLAGYDTTVKFLNLAVTSNGNVFITDAANNSTIFKMVNGGELQKQSINNFYTGSGNDVFFVSDDTGYISKAKNTNATEFGLGVTYDGGNTWNFVNTSQSFESLNPAIAGQFSFLNGQVGYVAAETGINYLHNGNWQMTSNFANGLTGVYAVSEQIAYAITRGGKVFKTVDGGNNFLQIGEINTSGGFADLHFITEQAGYAGIGSNIFKTQDGGATWQSVVSLAKGFITEIHFTDANHGWACDTNGDVFMYKK